MANAVIVQPGLPGAKLKWMVALAPTGLTGDVQEPSVVPTGGVMVTFGLTGMGMAGFFDLWFRSQWPRTSGQQRDKIGVSGVPIRGGLDSLRDCAGRDRIAEPELGGGEHGKRR
jgi:hypothetical protein